MIVPTSVLRIRVFEDGHSRVNLWIPLIVLWLFAIAVMVVLAPIALLLYVVWPRSRTYILLGPCIIGLCWAMRGLEVRIADGEDGVLVSCK